jgi:hypothetical protein
MRFWFDFLNCKGIQRCRIRTGFGTSDADPDLTQGQPVIVPGGSTDGETKSMLNQRLTICKIAKSLTTCNE